MNKNKTKLLFNNLIFYGGLTTLAKAFPLIMMPIVTRLLPDTSVYGISESFNVISGFGSQIVLLGMYDAMFREFFEYKENAVYQKKVTSSALLLVGFVGIVLFLLSLIFCKPASILFFSSERYIGLVILSGFYIFINSLGTILQGPSRMRNNRKVFLYSGIGIPLINYILIISFIYMGLTYEALIYSTVIGSLILMLYFWKLNWKDFSYSFFEIKVVKELLKVGLPMVPIFLVYWGFSSVDRIMIGKVLGPSELGIYSVGARVASISQLIATAFSSGWGFFLYETMNDKKRVEYNTKILNYFFYITIVGFFIMYLMKGYLFSVLLKGDYLAGEVVFPYLFLSGLLLVVYQIIGSQFLIIKKSYFNSIILTIGCLINIGLNFILIKLIGINGSAVATDLSFLFSILLIMIFSIRHDLLEPSKEFGASFSILIVSLILALFKIDLTIYSLIAIILVSVINSRNIVLGAKYVWIRKGNTKKNA